MCKPILVIGFAGAKPQADLYAFTADLHFSCSAHRHLSPPYSLPINLAIAINMAIVLILAIMASHFMVKNMVVIGFSAKNSKIIVKPEVKTMQRYKSNCQKKLTPKVSNFFCIFYLF